MGQLVHRQRLHWRSWEKTCFPYSHVKTAKTATRHVCAERVAMTVKPNRVRIDPNDILKCQSCDSINLHHGRLEIFNRSAEDSRTGIHIIVEPMSVWDVDDRMANNPSPRRNGFFLSFTCEMCEAKPTLAVFQHKGSTYMEWM
jgi:hypothetical protein